MPKKSREKQTRKKRISRKRRGGMNSPIKTPTNQPITSITANPNMTLSDLDAGERDLIRFTKCIRRSLGGKIDEMCTFDSEKMIKEYSTREISDIIFDGLDKSLRSVVEPLAASTQCKKTIGECGNPCICWLCGIPIMPPSKMHCDHVLPIVRAIMFSAVKSTNKIEKRAEFNAAKLQTYLDESYSYAHDKCNIKKSDKLLIRFESNKLVYDSEEGEKLAGILYDTMQLESDKQQWIENKSNEYKEKIERLLIPINQEIGAILKIKGATMDTYWRYTMEIMKSYASEKALNEYARGNVDKLKEKAQFHKENAIDALAKYSGERYKELKTVSRKLRFDESMQDLSSHSSRETKKRRIST